MWPNCWKVSAATVPAGRSPGYGHVVLQSLDGHAQRRRNLGISLIRRYVGGKDGGRSVLTKQADIILARYEEMNEALHDVADRQFRQWFNDEELQKLQKMEG